MWRSMSIIRLLFLIKCGGVLRLDPEQLQCVIALPLDASAKNVGRNAQTPFALDAEPDLLLSFFALQRSSSITRDSISPVAAASGIPRSYRHSGRTDMENTRTQSNPFPVGRIVWALIPGCPWWPAMVVDRTSYEPRICRGGKLPPQAAENRLVLFLNDNDRVAVVDVSLLLDYPSNIHLIHGVVDIRLIRAVCCANFYFARDQPRNKDAIKNVEAAALSAYSSAKNSSSFPKATVRPQFPVSPMASLAAPDDLAFGPPVHASLQLPATNGASGAGSRTAPQINQTVEVSPTSPTTPPPSGEASPIMRCNTSAGQSPVHRMPGTSTQNQVLNVSASKFDQTSKAAFSRSAKLPPSRDLQPQNPIPDTEPGVSNTVPGIQGYGRSMTTCPTNYAPIQLKLPIKRRRVDPMGSNRPSTVEARTGASADRNAAGIAHTGPEFLSRIDGFVAEMQMLAGSLRSDVDQMGKEQAERKRELVAVCADLARQRAQVALLQKECAKETKKLAAARKERKQEEIEARKATLRANGINVQNKAREKRRDNLNAESEDLAAKNKILEVKNEEKRRKGEELDAANKLHSKTCKQLEARNEELMREWRNLQRRLDEDEKKSSALRAELFKTTERVAAEKRVLHTFQGKTLEIKSKLQFLQGLQKKAKANSNL